MSPPVRGPMAGPPPLGGIEYLALTLLLVWLVSGGTLDLLLMFAVGLLVGSALPAMMQITRHVALSVGHAIMPRRRDSGTL